MILRDLPGSLSRFLSAYQIVVGGGRKRGEAERVEHWAYVPAGVGAALAFAVSTHLKHLSAADVPDAQSLHPSAVGRLVRASVAHRLWLGGLVADAFGLTLQIVALHLGPLAAVQPLLILGLLFALLLRQRHHGRLNPVVNFWAALVAASLAGVLILGGFAAGPHARADSGPAFSAAAVGLLLAAVCMLLGRRQRGSGWAAALLGCAVGVVYATTAALLKAITDIAVKDLPSVLWSWQLYAVIILGAGGLVLNQLAFQAGPLTASLPAISTVDPLLSIVIGVWVFDEHLHRGAGGDTVLGILLLVLGIGVIQLARTPPPGER